MTFKLSWKPLLFEEEKWIIGHIIKKIMLGNGPVMYNKTT